MVMCTMFEFSNVMLIVMRTRALLSTCLFMIIKSPDRLIVAQLNVISACLQIEHNI